MQKWGYGQNFYRTCFLIIHFLKANNLNPITPRELTYYLMINTNYAWRILKFLETVGALRKLERGLYALNVIPKTFLDFMKMVERKSKEMIG